MKHLLSSITVLLCLVGLTSCESGNPETAAETEPVPSECIYTIVRGDSSSKEETDGAVRLRNTLQEYGIAVELVTDWVGRGENVEDHRYPNEILFGDTNRQESADAYAALCIGTPDMVNYSLSSNENHYILAASAGYVDQAVTELLALFTEDLTRLHTAPVEVDVSEKHLFPLDDILIDGVSIGTYDGIVYENTYSSDMIDDVEGLSRLIFDACGITLPVLRESPLLTGTYIRIGEDLDPEVQSGGDFSYGIVPYEGGLLLEGQDVWNDWCAMDALMERISSAISAGETLSLDEPIRRITDPADDDPLASLQIAAWVISSAEMTAEEQFAEIAECGFNQIIISRSGQLFHDHGKWMAKYQLRGLWHDSTVHLETWQNNGSTILNPGTYMGESITWGHMLRDEPNADMYADLAEMFTQYETAFPGKVPFINLFPIYANADQMQVPTYQEYVDRFFAVVKPWYASVDIYPLNVSKQIIDNYFVNLDIFATACRDADVPFGVYIQTVSFAASKRTPTEAEIRWQAYNALAFGATNIEYFTYRTPDSSTESFRDALIGRDNQKTDRWYSARNVNAALSVMAEAFLQYDHLGCWGV
ncbi:MAG: beta-galactosidase, partial [Clostridia bacterium]|nr:beta-galactosidase [Clostridia bacterium]